MPISLHALNMSFSRAAPSSSEYWVWTCRCVNGGFDTVLPPGRTSGDGLRTVWGDSVEVYAPRHRHTAAPAAYLLAGEPGTPPRRAGRWRRRKIRSTLVSAPPAPGGTQRCRSPQLGDEQRGEEILAVFDTAFGELLAATRPRSG